MLKLKYLFENIDLAKMSIENWNYDKENLDCMLRYFRISSNAIYPYTYDGKTKFLRLSPMEEKLRNNIYGEIEFISYLNHINFPALYVLPSKQGNLVEEVSTPWGDYYTSVFERVPGIQMDKTDLSEEIVYEYGKALGKLHSVSSKYNPKTRRWSHIDVFEWIGEELKQHSGSEQAQKELHSIKEAFKELPINQDNYGLIHYDFELDNVFHNNEDNTCYVIDFDDSVYHWYALDVLIALNSLSEELEGERLRAAKDGLLKGYQAEYLAIDDMIQYFPLFQRFIDLYSYTRVLRIIQEQWKNEPEWLIELRENLVLRMKQQEKKFGRKEILER